ncbi:MAG: prealbumin-like fold domain-containing protein [Peptostreptococcus sp.]|uniref:prealbumin-like fold domain-containing protein n=1 Tax=Peptostreptococcus TaxID=1257 RepID=UPI002910DC24|nr:MULTISPECIES: prealbumin-like fold domain-containing protein [Peptostreptococcus]MDU3422835.1 prealbumin-like fold domain-containing protein [Peptostreptococcus anaerobius]MDU3429719.1 prealbumin-like fold domain-containing protein [Peptostreptococcus sp.]MDU3454636.1 prealbumin-like fold domain-containing protein [Peptostreptococcus sp.]MDU5681112.1 prealbumin-like fold domain-containing protein [Peptostreptococcus sp.]MDU5738089.1 prealbumin-like fold domain-containing protein [Peptostrep
MTKHIKNLITRAFALILGFVLTISVASADTSTAQSASVDKVIVNIYLARQLLSTDAGTTDDSIITDTTTNKKYKRLEGRSLLIWKMDKHIDGEDIDSKKTALADSLHNIKNEVLTKKYGEPIKTGKSDRDGHIRQSLEKKSTYYVREDIAEGQTPPYVSSFVIVVGADSPSEIDIYSKSVYQPDEHPNPKEYGRKRFVKVDSDNTDKRLHDAVFRVVKKVGGSYRAVLKNGVHYVVSSNKYGEFVVEDLPYGTYYLFEIKPPSGYRQLAAPVEFTISRDDNQTSLEMIKNSKDTSTGGGNSNNGGGSGGSSDTGTKGKGIVVPKTGDVMLLLLVVGGGLVSSLGHLMVRDDKKKFFQGRL